MSDNSYILRTEQQSLNDSHHQALLFWCTTHIHPKLHSSKNFQICFLLSSGQETRALWATGIPVHHGNVRGWGAKYCIWFVISCFSLYHPAANSLNSPGTLLLGGTQQGKLFLKYCFPWSAYFAKMQTTFLTREKQLQFLNSKELIKNKINWKLLWANQHNRRAMLRLGE